jgi:hypothetical protein
MQFLSDYDCHSCFHGGAANTKPRMLAYRHSGLDPESRAFSTPYNTGCRIKSGMTIRNQVFIVIATQWPPQE